MTSAEVALLTPSMPTKDSHAVFGSFSAAELLAVNCDFKSGASSARKSFAPELSSTYAAARCRASSGMYVNQFQPGRIANQPQPRRRRCPDATNRASVLQSAQLSKSCDGQWRMTLYSKQ